MELQPKNMAQPPKIPRPPTSAPTTTALPSKQSLYTRVKPFVKQNYAVLRNGKLVPVSADWDEKKPQERDPAKESELQMPPEQRDTETEEKQKQKKERDPAKTRELQTSRDHRDSEAEKQKNEKKNCRKTSDTESANRRRQKRERRKAKKDQKSREAKTRVKAELFSDEGIRPRKGEIEAAIPCTDLRMREESSDSDEDLQPVKQEEEEEEEEENLQPVKQEHEELLRGQKRFRCTTSG